MSGGVIESAHNYAIQLRESANDGSDFANGETDYRVVFLGEDGLLHAKDSAGTVTSLGGTGLTDPMTTRGDIIVRNSSNATARLAIGSSGKVLSSDGTDISWQTPASSAGALLGYKLSTAGAVTTTSSSLADADATNLAVTFTAPASTNVLVRLSAQMSPSAGGAEAVGTLTNWGLRESTSNIAGAKVAARVLVGGATVTDIRSVSLNFVLLGISAGSHTYKWAFSTSAGTTRIYASATEHAIMEVIALP